MARYRADGLEALYPKPRCDRGRSRALSPEVASLLVGIKEREPGLSVAKLILRARREGPLPAAVRLAPSTVYRLLREQGLLRRAPREEASQDLRRWGYERAGELWMSDVLHGPKILCQPGDRRRRRKSCLIAFIDDATRVIPHAEFTFAESYANYLPVFKRALLKRGLPERLFVDNGSVYRCHHLRVACASLNIQLLHSRAYHPAGKGDIAGTGLPNGRYQPDYVGDPNPANPTPAVWLNQAAFAVPKTGTFGNAGRNSLRADGINNIDFSFFKVFSVAGKFEVEYRVELFNGFNSPQYLAPSSNISRGNFCRVLATANRARQIQMGLKLYF